MFFFTARRLVGAGLVGAVDASDGALVRGRLCVYQAGGHAVAHTWLEPSPPVKSITQSASFDCGCNFPAVTSLV